MRMRNSIFVLSIFVILAISCSNRQSSDYTTLKQKALEIPPDFQLEPPTEGQEEIVNLPGSNESQDIQTLLEDSTSIESSSDEVVNADMNLEEFVEQNFLTKKETAQEDNSQEIVDEQSLAAEAKKAREELFEYVTANNEAEEIDLVEEKPEAIVEEEPEAIVEEEPEAIVEEEPEAIIEEEPEAIIEEAVEEFNEEEFLEELADTEDITSLPEEEQLEPMILDDLPEDNTDFGDEDLNDLLDRVEDLLNTYSSD